MTMALQLAFSAEKYTDELSEIFTLMSDGVGGAEIEEKFDVFGEAIIEALDVLLNLQSLKRILECFCK